MSGYEAAEDLYQRELDKAMIKLCSGTFSKEKVLSETVHSLAESGLRSIDFKSGYSMQLDTAVRLAVRTGSSQIAARIMDNNIASTGENLIFVSKHWGARNTGTGHANHEQWQGRVYFIKEGTDYSKEAERIGQNGITSLWLATGYSADGAHQNDPLGLNGYNCRHKHYVWFEGISEFPPEEPEPEPVIINGKKYDYYAATQKMRSMERGVRALKREREALKAMKKDTKEIDARIKRRTSEYEEFCKKCGIKEKSERLRYECGTSDLKKTKAWEKAFVNGDKSGLQEVKEDDTISIDNNEQTVEQVAEPVKELKPIEDFKTPENKDYVRLLHGSQGTVSVDDRIQIHNHEKADGSGGGYVATTNYSTINSNLRGDGYAGNKLDDDDKKTIESLRAAISQYQLDDDYVMTRYVNGDYISSVFGIKTRLWKKGDLENITDSITRIANPYVVKEGIPNITKELQEHIGETITEKAFVSFSVVPNKNIMKNKSVKINILAKKGTNCYIPVNRRESEGIFADGSDYVLRDVQWDDEEKKWILTMQID